MRGPRFLKTLHLRIALLFLLLLAASAAAYYFWIQTTLFRDEPEPATERWYAENAASELDSLALTIAPFVLNHAWVEELLVDYGRGISQFGAEIDLFDSQGRMLFPSSADSLSQVIHLLDTNLLDAMATPDWDFNTFPNPYDHNAFENRIFAVIPLWEIYETTLRPDAYLVASYAPLEFSVEQMEAYDSLVLQAVVVMLIAAAISGFITMIWLSRRIQTLNAGVNTFRQGDLDHRIPDRSQDEIGELSRSFNAMAVQLASTIDKLKRSERFHRQLVSNLSHDLRTPLATIRAYVETLSDKSDLLTEAEQSRYMENLTMNVDYLGRLIDHLIQLSKLDSGEARFQMEDFQIEELVVEVLTRCEGMANQIGVDLSWQSSDEIPLVNADPLQVGLALQNLIENGIKFNKPAGSVSVLLGVRNGEVEVEVRDSGIGIKDDDLPHIFDRFYTADKSRTRKGESSGLGLAIARMILAEHSRELTVQARDGDGTSFKFTLPATAQSRQSDQD